MTDASEAPRKQRSASEAWNRHAFRDISGLAVLVLATGTVVYHYIEDWS